MVSGSTFEKSKKSTRKFLNPDVKCTILLQTWILMVCSTHPSPRARPPQQILGRQDSHTTASAAAALPQTPPLSISKSLGKTAALTDSPFMASPGNYIFWGYFFDEKISHEIFESFYCIFKFDKILHRYVLCSLVQDDFCKNPSHTVSGHEHQTVHLSQHFSRDTLHLNYQ